MFYSNPCKTFLREYFADSKAVLNFLLYHGKPKQSIKPRLPGPFDGAADHRGVPDVQPVEKAAGDGRPAGRGRLGDRMKDPQGLHLQRK